MSGLEFPQGYHLPNKGPKILIIIKSLKLYYKQDYMSDKSKDKNISLHGLSFKRDKGILFVTVALLAGSQLN